MEINLAQFGDRAVLVNIAITGVIFILVVGVRTLVMSAVKRRQLPLPALRRWTSSSRNATMLVFVLLALPLWFEPLKSLAISLVAVAAALVLATKELIMCMSGALLRTTSKMFDIGDRIEIGGVRGDVIDTNLFTTTILEIGPGDLSHQQTGRAIVIPNGKLLSEHLVNETFTDAFVLHTFQVPVKLEPGWERAEAVLRREVENGCVEWLEQAKRHFETLSQERGFDPPVVDARVTLQVTAPDHITLVARLPVPTRHKGKVEQDILRAWLAQVAISPAGQEHPAPPAEPPLASPGAATAAADAAAQAVLAMPQPAGVKAPVMTR